MPRNFSNPEERREYQNAYYNKRAQVIRDIKESSPCVDCGVRYPYYVMQFDHVRGSKVKALGAMRTWSLEKVLGEIEKCDLVCANCHAARTFLRL